ncbi:ABC transporter ATP-binding protein [uncultured Microbacterium sp.]|uniref:ABC transporter ATP-binding protein n=1 Tax=uncultured Microbacterium sp. TaxID=191216 RepID=UPI0025CEE909|nr:ABC transporter ATP-binding protein [uncultured Microbacterium sp.]
MLGRLIWRYTAPAWPLVVGVIVFQLLQSVASLLLPTLNAAIIDDGVITGDIGYIWRTGGLMLLVSLGQVGCAIAAVYFGSRLAMGMGRSLRSDVFGRVVSFSQREVARFGAASLITRSTNDVQQVQMLVQMGATMMVAAPMLAIGGVIFAVQQDPRLSWLMVVSVPILLIIVALIVVRMIPAFRQMQARIDRINLVLREQLTGIRVIRAFVRERQERERFRQGSDDVADSALRAGNLMALMFPAVMVVMNVSSVAVIWFGAFQVQAGELQIGTLIAFLSYLMQILMGVMMATFMFVMIPRAAVCAGRIGEVLETETSVVAPSAPETLPALARERGTALESAAGAPTGGRVELRDVEFRYPGADAPVLHELSFAVEPGTTTAIIGGTGAGKSTLIGLVPRLFDVTAGSVEVDGVDVRRADPDDLWARIGLVPQRAFLFSGTVASNLRYGNAEASDDELRAALRTAQALDFVERMPEGLDAPIAQGGTNVSGGQRQRLAIARALIRHPEILIFDDSFSALDLRTDKALRAALDRDFASTTRIVVAQRVSTIVHADQIIVLEHGRIVGRGTHDELLESNETYRETVDSQASAEAAA